MKTPVFLTFAALGLLSLSAVVTVSGFKQLHREQMAHHARHENRDWSKRMAFQQEIFIADARLAVAVVRYLLQPAPTPAEARSFAAYFANTNPAVWNASSHFSPVTAGTNPSVTSDGGAGVQATNGDLLSQKPLLVSLALFPTRVISSRFGSENEPAAQSPESQTLGVLESRGDFFHPALEYNRLPGFSAIQPLNAVSRFVFRNLRPMMPRG